MIRSADIPKAVEFYQGFGLEFVLESHGGGPEHFAATVDGLTLEIYPLRQNQTPTTSVRLGFQVDRVDELVSSLQAKGVTVVSQPSDSQWGRRAVVKDFDGHIVELVTLLDSNKEM